MWHDNNNEKRYQQQVEELLHRMTSKIKLNTTAISTTNKINSFH